jgi:hypothetical protein
MSWRVQLPQQFLHRVDFLSAEKTVVATWIQADRVQFYDQRNGNSLGERVIEKLASTDRQEERWRTFVAGLAAPNGLFLPLVRLQNMTLLATEDGRIRLYQLREGGFVLETGGKELPIALAEAAQIVAADMDRALGLLTLLDDKGHLHIYQQRIRVGTYPSELRMDGEYSPLLFVPHGGKLIVAADGQQVAIFDTSGKVLRRLELHFEPGVMAVSPDGKHIVLADAETGVLRVYRGDDLMPAYQRFAIDLAADARRLNAAAGNPPPTHVPGVVAINNRGVLAFGLGGLLCVTSLARMKPVP